MRRAYATLDDDLRGALALLQQQIKCGLSSTAAIGFFEAGFADRVVAMELANLLPEVRSRSEARTTVRQQAGAVRAALAEYPSYFSAVLVEVAAG